DADRRRVEPTWSDANDRHRCAVHDHGLVENMRAGGEAVPPKRIAQHDDGRLARRTIIARANETAERGLQAEDRKVAARDEQRFTVQRLATKRQVGADHPMRGYSGKYGLSLLEIAEHRNTEDAIAITRLAARVRSWLWPWSSEVDEARRFWNRKRPKQQLVEQREDRRRGADTERERQNCDEADEGGLDQRANGEPDVAHEPQRLRVNAIERARRLPWDSWPSNDPEPVDRCFRRRSAAYACRPHAARISRHLPVGRL